MPGRPTEASDKSNYIQLSRSFGSSVRLQAPTAHLNWFIAGRQCDKDTDINGHILSESSRLRWPAPKTSRPGRILWPPWQSTPPKVPAQARRIAWVCPRAIRYRSRPLRKRRSAMYFTPEYGGSAAPRSRVWASFWTLSIPLYPPTSLLCLSRMLSGVCLTFYCQFVC